jgi:hypothetical protein
VTVLDNGVAAVPPALSAVDVAAHQRRAVHLTDTVRKGSTTLLVTSDQPVIVERDLYKVKAPGTAMAAAIPLRQ